MSATAIFWNFLKASKKDDMQPKDESRMDVSNFEPFLPSRQEYLSEAEEIARVFSDEEPNYPNPNLHEFIKIVSDEELIVAIEDYFSWKSTGKRKYVSTLMDLLLSEYFEPLTYGRELPSKEKNFSTSAAFGTFDFIAQEFLKRLFFSQSLFTKEDLFEAYWEGKYRSTLEEDWKPEAEVLSRNFLWRREKKYGISSGG